MCKKEHCPTLLNGFFILTYGRTRMLWHAIICLLYTSFNPDYKIYTHYKLSKNEREGLSSPIVGTIIEGEEGQLWIATEEMCIRDRYSIVE